MLPAMFLLIWLRKNELEKIEQLKKKWKERDVAKKHSSFFLYFRLSDSGNPFESCFIKAPKNMSWRTTTFFILSSDELFKKIRRKVHRKCVILDSYDLCGALCVYLLNFSDVSPSQSSMRSKSIAFSDAMSFRRHLNIKWTQTLCSLFLRMPNANTHIITF